MIDRALIKPARQHNESFKDYVIRRAEANRVLKQYLSKGKTLWESLKYVTVNLNAKGQMIHPLAEGDAAVVAQKIYVKKRLQGTYRKPQAARTRRGV